jgi:aspartate aminotransferase
LPPNLAASLTPGGWRVGLARFAAAQGGRRLRKQIVATAGEVWSTAARPMQEARACALDEPPEIIDHLKASTSLHGRIAAAVHNTVISARACCNPPKGGFYVHPDFEPGLPIPAAGGVTNAARLESCLLVTRRIGVLGRHHFGDHPGRLRFRAAASQLYGSSTDEQWAALRCSDPVLLPHIARPLGPLRTALMTLTDETRAA